MKATKIFMTWNDDDASDECPDEGFWMQYDSIEDAVSENGDNVEIFEATPKYVGTFKRKVSLVKTKNNKRGK